MIVKKFTKQKEYSSMDEKLEGYSKLAKAFTPQKSKVYAKNSLTALVPLAACALVPNMANAQCGNGQLIGSGSYNGFPDLYIDVDGDGTADFNIFHASSNSANIVINGLSGASFAYSLIGGFPYAANVGSSAAINSTTLSMRTAAATFTYQFTSGNWTAPTSGFLPIIVNGNFGFLSLSINAGLNVAVDFITSGLEDATGGTDGLGVVTPGDCATVLPVELTKLEASAKQKMVMISWQTTSETNNEGFVIERSVDGNEWDKAGWIDGRGNSQSLNDYVFEDIRALPNVTYYYRLKQMDFDGKHEYSSVVSAMIEDGRATGISPIFPNPAATKANFQINANDDMSAKISVYDAVGNLVLSKEQNVVNGANSVEMDLTQFDNGMYFTKVEMGEESFYQKLVVKK